ncbi:hypothetical protein I302_102842 [Kwoniella bestiolae CBS 10118]|uniref:Uncharacterized protein n=1 Tax=Kwoniella bestiolae CBS 10118 TaxID=1296100 RepID=A0A1B9GG55_9TREE|nr:hypothetical protein I302_01537 [Kwoniella bestiolae CBS 10118]OCF30019.1 hypothetical protein I302_01537 [Kwoniella bestiolae CBS 10118]
MPFLHDAAPGSEVHPIDLTNENTPKSDSSSDSGSRSNYQSPNAEWDHDHDHDHRISPSVMYSAGSNPNLLDNSDHPFSFWDASYGDIDIGSELRNQDTDTARYSTAPDQLGRPRTHDDVSMSTVMDMDMDDVTSNLKAIQTDLMDYEPRQRELTRTTKETARRIYDQSVSVRETLKSLYEVMPRYAVQGVSPAPSNTTTPSNPTHIAQRDETKTNEEYKRRIENLETTNRELQDANREQELRSRVLQGEVAARDLELMRLRRD